MVSPLGETDVNGKENVFNTGRTKPSIASTKGFPQGADKRKRSNTKGKETFEDGAEMLREFDQLLVRQLSHLVGLILIRGSG